MRFIPAWLYLGILCLVAIAVPQRGDKPLALEIDTLSASHKRRLHVCFGHLVDFIAFSSLDTNLADPAVAATVLSLYIQFCADANLAVSRGKYAVFAVQTIYPHLRRNLSRPWKVLDS